MFSPAAKFRMLTPIAVLTAFCCACLAVFVFAASAAEPADPAVAQAPAGKKVTLTGTLTQRTRDSGASSVNVRYALVTDSGRRYTVDFSDPSAKLHGPAGDLEATASNLKDVSGYPVVVDGRLSGRRLTALNTEVLDRSPLQESSPGLLEDIKTFLFQWTPIIFMGLLVIFLFWAIRLMPRNKTQRIKPQSFSSVRWDDVAGCEEAKNELREVVDFLREPARFRALGAAVPKGILLHGPPGTGKTLLAKAVAHESRANFFSQSASSFVEMFAGLGAARVRRLFATARKHPPAILFIDELDAIGMKRGFDMSREKDQTLNQLLVEMDGFEERGQLIIIGASNRIENLDPALLRPGRFDRQVLVGPPDLTGRLQILGVHTRGKPLRDVDLRIVAQQTSGLTGADLANICNEAAIAAGRTDRDHIKQRDFESALERVIAGLQTRKVMRAQEKEIVAYHEAGHALVGELLGANLKIHRVSIVPRGTALGYVLNLPEEDRYLMSKQDLMIHLKALFGGYVAEQVVFGRVTTGPSDDLRRIVEISRSMIEEYGMGSQLIAQLGDAKESLSDEARSVRDREQQALIDEAQSGARALVAEYRDVLDALAERLLLKETLDRDEIELIIETTLARTGKQRPALEEEATVLRISDKSRRRSGRFDRDSERKSIPPPERKSVAPPAVSKSKSKPPPSQPS